MSKIKKILIANRGEIACRVIKTARKMGIKTVAVYSDADSKALHVRMADEAVHIGASPAAESYLVMDKIIDACKTTGADAVHPGYGFLSENPAFARALKKAKITFIGPAPESMEAMGLKDAAKALMTKAGVPVTPGYQGDNQDAKHLAKEAAKIGYPVLIKAVAGGGGKGMRKVERAEDFEDMLASCQREAKSSFGNDIVLIEKYITSPRHIEVQVFGDTDTYGNVVHMFERDCSLQRRHQKVIEEAPAPGMTDKVRKAMTDAAVNAAKAVNYVGAGTVEFIVDGSGKLKEDGFWFMEMNTRLQVEHPVTEMITGLDLVELQIRVAQGEKLPEQKDIKMEGHAIEARLYAEDPANDFLPSIGKLTLFEAPSSIRVDTGIESGDEISIFYDPMVAKLVAFHDESRFEAIRFLASCLAQTKIEGVRTNKSFMGRCLHHPGFASEKASSFDLSTHFIATHNEQLNQIGYSENDAYIALASAILTDDLTSSEGEHPFDVRDSWRPNISRNLIWYFLQNEQTVAAEIVLTNKDKIDVKVGDSKTFSIQRANSQVDKLVLAASSGSDKISLSGWVREFNDDRVRICDGYYDFDVARYNPAANEAAGVSADNITAPMPGKIISVEAKPGDTVKAGDKLIVMEAMKMEMSLDAPRDGIVAVVNVAADRLVNDGDVLLELEKEE